MDLSYPEEAEAFRMEVRGWLEENLPKGWGQPGFSMSPDERAAFDGLWTKKLAEGAFICASWPTQYGGRGLSLMEGVVLNEEFARLNAPMRADFFGDTLVGPTILKWGTEDQKTYFLPKILSGEISWCQGFSEPDAGSDLASLSTRAELDGDEWRINGQKVWTTQAQYADYMFLLARTDPEAPRHRGISYLLVPMRQDGIEVRPIAQMDGSAEFNEVFFSNALCPVENVVGGVNNGWAVAMDTLGFERGTSATTGHRRFQKELGSIIEAARRNGKIGDPLVRQDLARAWSKVKIMQINGLRALSSALNGDSSAAALSATNKMYWSEYHRDTMEMAMDILGMEGQVLPDSGNGGTGDRGPGSSYGDGGDIDLIPGVGARHHRPGYAVSPIQASFFFSRSETIWGGTAQIQRNIVGERILGLPKEPRAGG